MATLSGRSNGPSADQFLLHNWPRDTLKNMSSGLSPHIEQKIAEALAGGLYPSRQALLEDGVEQLLDIRIPSVPDEHMPLVEAAITSSAAGNSGPMTRAQWDQLHSMVDAIAAGKNVPLE
jgi:hypothetical protein